MKITFDRHLVNGAGGTDGAFTKSCVMEHVAMHEALLMGLVDLRDILAHKTDNPGCTASHITDAAIMVNDNSDEVERQRLLRLEPRLLRARRPPDPEKAVRVALRDLCWAVRSILDVECVGIAPFKPEDAESLVEKIEHWLATGEGWVNHSELDADTRDQPVVHPLTKVFHTILRGDFYGDVFGSSICDVIRVLCQQVPVAERQDLVLWLDDLLDVHDKSLVEEGCYDGALPGDPDLAGEWEAEFVAWAEKASGA